MVILDAKNFTIIASDEKQTKILTRALQRAGIKNILLADINIVTNNFSFVVNIIDNLFTSRDLAIFYGGLEENFNNMLDSFTLDKEKSIYLGHCFKVSELVKKYWNLRLSLAH